MAKRSLDIVYIGMLSKDGYFESYTERQVRDRGGNTKRPGSMRYLYHHGMVFKDMSPLKNWEDVYSNENTLRFTRKRRHDAREGDKDNFVIIGGAMIKPFKKKNKKQIAQLARLLVGVGINPKVKFEGAHLALPVEEAPYQRKIIGTLEEFINE